jgi:hypothetical protein
MRNITSFLMALFSIYRCHAYDLVLSSCVISLAYGSLCSITYASYVVRLVDLSYGGGSLYFLGLPPIIPIEL